MIEQEHRWFVGAVDGSKVELKSKADAVKYLRVSRLPASCDHVLTAHEFYALNSEVTE